MKIGFMGGTFSPPHKGHLHSARVFAKELHLDKLLIIPAKVSPFKMNDMPTASEEDRMEMARLCFSELDAEGFEVEISDIEVSKEGVSYTIDTINALKGLYPGCELFMFVGSDMFFSLEKWKCSEEIFKCCTIYTRCREQNERESMLFFKEKYQKKYNASVFFSDDKEFVVSSTEVRAALHTKNLETCQNLLTDDVLRYIIRGGLYFEQ